MKVLSVTMSWLAVLTIPFSVNSYLKTGTVHTRWGLFTGTNARDAFWGFLLMKIIFGGYAFWETFKYIRNKYYPKVESVEKTKRF